MQKNTKTKSYRLVGEINLENGEIIIEGFSTVIAITPLIMSRSINILTVVVVVVVVTQHFRSITTHCGDLNN